MAEFLYAVVDVLRWVLIAGFVILFVYVAVRAASVAHFRSRMDYWRSRQRELREGKRNGKE